MRAVNVSTVFSLRAWPRLIFYSPELNQLTGIAAILTYPMDVEVVQEEEKSRAAITNSDDAMQ
jgi:hypothetical protein